METKLSFKGIREHCETVADAHAFVEKVKNIKVPQDRFIIFLDENLQKNQKRKLLPFAEQLVEDLDLKKKEVKGE